MCQVNFKLWKYVRTPCQNASLCLVLFPNISNCTFDYIKVTHLAGNERDETQQYQMHFLSYYDFLCNYAVILCKLHLLHIFSSHITNVLSTDIPVVVVLVCCLCHVGAPHLHKEVTSVSADCSCGTFLLSESIPSSA